MYEEKIKLAMQGTPLKEIDTEAMAERLDELMQDTFAYVGYKQPEAKLYARLIMNLIDDLVEFYPFLTLDEVAICFKMGVRDRLGSFVGLNMHTFSMWLSAFINCEERCAARELIWKERDEAERKRRSEEDGGKSLWELSQLYYRNFLDNNTERDLLGFVVYDFLVSKGAIADSQQDLDEMLKHADRRPMELRRRGECGRINVKEYVDSPNIWAKQELLKRYFQQLQMEGAEEIPPVT